MFQAILDGKGLLVFPSGCYWQVGITLILRIRQCGTQTRDRYISLCAAAQCIRQLGCLHIDSEKISVYIDILYPIHMHYNNLLDCWYHLSNPYTFRYILVLQYYY